MNFAVVAPFPELGKQVRQVSDELGYRIPIVIGDLNEGLLKAKQIIQDNSIEVIVSRGGTAKLIEENLNVPVVAIEISTFDLIRAVVEAKKLGNKIGVVGFKNIIHGCSSLGQYLDAEIIELEINSSDELPKVIEDAKAKDIDVIIGDNISTIMGEKHGVKSIRVTSGNEAIGIALNKASSLANVRRNEKIKSGQLRSIVETTHEGIIATNKDGIITLVNSSAEKMLSREKGELIGSSIEDIISRDIFRDIYKTKKSYIGEIFKFERLTLVQNISPVIIDDEILGIVVTMNDTDYVESVETKVRKELYLKGYVAQYNFSDIITKSEKMKSVIEKARNYGKSDFTVLIIGDSGTGKEMIAQSIHNSSSRKDGPFIAVNSAVMPENLLESELFGYEEGAFTGARKGGKKGLFELAHNGTLFLDEIGEMPLTLQARLLRVLQEKSIMRVGGDRVISINTRIISATHRDLKKAVEEGKFRKDLYYRLNVLNITVPSLSERMGDIPDLVIALNERITRNLKTKPPMYREDSLSYLANIKWTGNVRQIENIVSRIAVLYSGKEISVDMINEVLDFENSVEYKDRPLISLYIDKLNMMERDIIDYVMKLTNNDKDKTCEILGISKTTIWRKLKEN
jgi:transcriptional regulator with PAS, ATPase and Fis domain